MGKTNCFSVCRKKEKKDCKTRFCNYISGPQREFCRLTPQYQMDPLQNCTIKKKYTKKNSELFINKFVNANLKRKKTNKLRNNATKKIIKFVDYNIKRKRDNKKLKSITPINKSHNKVKMFPVEQVSELVKRENMYNPEIQFYFYSGSKNAPPGKGAREKMPTEYFEEYNDSLREFPDFRKMLSNFGEAPFHLDGLDWNSVEHYYQGAKFKKNNPEFYKLFSLNSGSELSKDPNMAKAYGGKTGKYKGKQVRNKSIVVDEDFFTGRGNQEMFDSQFAKFTQNDNMRRLLLATKEAQLLHTMPRSPISIPFDNLVYIRELIKTKQI